MNRSGHLLSEDEYHTQPLVVPVVSGYVPVEERRRGGVFAPLPPDDREERVPVPMREVVCYECGKSSQIPAAALSAHCVHCRSHLNTADIELKPGTLRLTVRTLGDVFLPAGVELSHLSVICRHMSIAGRASGTLRCTGTLTLRGSARVEGQVQAGCLVVAAGAQAEVSPSVAAESAEVAGQITGRLHVSGGIHIGREGALLGDCRAAQLTFDPGGRHSGRWVRTVS